jgi:Helix-turn-helix domain
MARRLVDFKGLCEYLPQLSPWTLRRYSAAGKLPCLKIGRRRLFDLGHIDAWLRTCERPGDDATSPTPRA